MICRFSKLKLVENTKVFTYTCTPNQSTVIQKANSVLTDGQENKFIATLEAAYLKQCFFSSETQAIKDITLRLNNSFFCPNLHLCQSSFILHYIHVWLESDHVHVPKQQITYLALGCIHIFAHVPIKKTPMVSQKMFV